MDINCSVFESGVIQATLKNTLHQKVINTCSLWTCTCEEFTPLFTTLHAEPLTENLWNLWDIKKWFQPPDRTERASISIPCAIRRWRGVKMGEEWCVTLHLSHPQCLSGFQPIWWRVKSKKASGCFTSSRRIVLCLAMAGYCPGKGQCCAIVRQYKRYKPLYASSVLSWRPFSNVFAPCKYYRCCL